LYQEFFDDIESAIAEKQLKGWSRAKKIALIEKINPGWEELTPAFDNLGFDSGSAGSYGLESRNARLRSG